MNVVHLNRLKVANEEATQKAVADTELYLNVLHAQVQHLYLCSRVCIRACEYAPLCV